jgi:hypothetical protein
MKQRLRAFLVFISVVLISLSATSQKVAYDSAEEIRWQSVQTFKIEDGLEISRLSFEGAYYPYLDIIPVFIKNYPVHTSSAKVSCRLQDEVYLPLTEQETSLLPDVEVPEKIRPVCDMTVVRGQPYVQVRLRPVRWNTEKNVFEKLVSFKVIIEVEDLPERYTNITRDIQNSVLRNGSWFKVRIDKSGLYKITYDELQQMGFDVSVNPHQIAVFGNGGGVLPEVNTDFRHKDLVENPIVVVGENDGSFDANDYILFYGQGPVTWKYNMLTGTFDYQTNYYDDYAYYFITSLDHNAKRIENQQPPSGGHDLLIDEFNDYACHELDERNLFKTGRTWFGEVYDFDITKEFVFDFPNLVKDNQSGYLHCAFAARAFSYNSMTIYVNNELEKSLTLGVVSSNDPYQLGRVKETNFHFTPDNDQLIVKTEYRRTSNSSIAYLDFIEVNVKRKLLMTEGQMMFRSADAGQDGQIVRYRLGNASSDLTVWDITDPVNPQKIQTQFSSGNLEFNAVADTLRQYIVFKNGAGLYQTEFVEPVENQNLHSVKNIDFLIVTYPDFMEEAKRLADFHRQNDGMNVYVTIPEKIYNEFSSGAQDITAIRDFVKHIYDQSDPGRKIKYLLLFGDASFDYKDRLADNTNFAPCWESIESMNIVNSIASDDYFGYLDDGEGGSSASRVDIGIGRFVVGTTEEAKAAVDKSIHYATNTQEVMQPWRNMITFAADDGDNNTHLRHAETLSDFVYENYPVYNVDKIYLDAYKQISTPGGQTSPDMNKAINDKIEKGTLIFNYNGHGGEAGLGHESIMQIADINSWTNYDKLALFITATCEFARYDDPTRVSAGEYVFLNKKGGGIALFSTARATFASSNLALNMAIYQNNIFEKTNGSYPCFGDVIMNSKVLGGNNDSKFVLLGDPALQLAYTDYGVKTVKINNHVVEEDVADTLRALAKVTIEGEVTDEAGNLLADFNGTVFPTVYDKFAEIETHGDENPSKTFYLRKNILFNGKTAVTNGRFNFEFIMPKDISYRYGGGRISYYVRNDSVDGSGYYENVIIGGFNETAEEDNEGPEITLFMNDTTFRSGDITDRNPDLLAYLFDESGINTTGNGIGHDILATIDDDQNKTYNLNDYYEADIGSFQKGTLRYPFSNLEDGPHVLSLRVWDIYNNSSTAYLEFVVMAEDEIVIENLINYPNPFISETNFVFDHNQSGQDLDVKIQIYTLSGQIIRTIEVQMNPESYKSVPVKWDGLNDNGSRISKGFYIYRVTVRKENGSTASETAKLVFLR